MELRRTHVYVIHDDISDEEDYRKGQEGFIDGYVRGANGKPYAVVDIAGSLVLVDLRHLETKTIGGS